MAAFVTLEDSTKPMRDEATAAGYYEPEHFRRQNFRRIQILTIEDVMSGVKRVEYPKGAPAVIFEKAEGQSKEQATQGVLM